MHKFFFTLLTVCHFSLQAQEIKMEQYIGWKSNFFHLNTISNKHQSCTFIMNDDSLKAFLLNNTDEVSELFTIPLLVKEKFRGGFIKENKIFLFLDNGTKPGLHTWLYNITDKSIKEETTPFTIRDERTIYWFSCDDYYFYLTINKSTKEFTIYSFTDQSHYNRFSIPIDESIINNLINKQDIFNSETLNVQKADKEGECDIEIAKSANKIYLKNDTLFLLMDRNIFVTDVFCFDLKNQQATFRSINHELSVYVEPSTVENPYTYNSFFSGNKLFHIAATYDSLWLHVNDFYSGQILNQYKAGNHDDIDFKNTPIIQEGSNFSMEGSKELDKTKQLLRKMLNGTSVITAMPAPDTNYTIITIGSYKKIEPSFNSGGITMPTDYPLVGGFARQSWVKSARFKLLYDNMLNKQIPGNIPIPINDKVEKYTEGIKIPANGENLFINNGHYYYTFYDKRKRKFLLVKF